MKMKKLWVLMGSALLVAGLSVGLMGCPEGDDDDDFFEKTTRVEQTVADQNLA